MTKRDVGYLLPPRPSLVVLFQGGGGGGVQMNLPQKWPYNPSFIDRLAKRLIFETRFFSLGDDTPPRPTAAMALITPHSSMQCPYSNDNSYEQGGLRCNKKTR